MNRKVVIAIDGPAASGKGTLSRELANKLGYACFATGNIYRGVAKLIISKNIDYKSEEKVSYALSDIDVNLLDYANIDNEDIAYVASIIAAYSKVRNILVSMQRKYIDDLLQSVVVEGRDIGSVVYKEADLKIFLTADVEIRANRRYKELQDKGIKVIYGDILADLISRDERDKNRPISPLLKSSDAIEIDSGRLEKKELVETCVSLIKIKLQQI